MWDALVKQICQLGCIALALHHNPSACQLQGDAFPAPSLVGHEFEKPDCMQNGQVSVLNHRNPRILNPKLYKSHYSRFHVLFHYPYLPNIYLHNHNRYPIEPVYNPYNSSSFHVLFHDPYITPIKAHIPLFKPYKL